MGKSIYIAIVAILIGTLGTSLPVHGEFPNDPQARQWSYEAADVYRAWELAHGSSSTIVAIIDNGFDTTHPDLKSTLWVNTREIPDNGIDDDRNGYIDDIHGWNFLDNSNKLDISKESDEEDSLGSHATMVAGLIAATSNNAIGGVGIAPGVKLMDLKIIDSQGLGETKPLVDAIYYAVNNGASVINISIVGYGFVPEVVQALNYAYQNGVIVVAAAGNESVDLDGSTRFPVCGDAHRPYTAVLGVSAIGPTRRLASFSNVGGSCIDLTAPGVNIGGSVRTGSDVDFKNGWNGTSFAAPFVTGAAALVKSVQQSWNIDQIVRVLKATAHHTVGSDEKIYQEAYGSGLLQVGAAIEAAQLGVVPAAKNFIAGETDESFTAARRILVSSQGGAVYDDIFEGNRIERPSNILGDAINFSAVRDINGSVYYVVIKKKNNTEQYVLVYDSSWKRRYRWSVDNRSYQILSANLYGDETKEIVLSATDSGNTVIQVFAIDGTLLRTIGDTVKHKSVHATVYQDLENDNDELLYVTEENDRRVVIQKIDLLLQEPQKLFETQLKTSGSVAVVNTSDEQLIAIGSDVGTGPVVSLFSLSGEVVGSFRPYDLSFRGGVNVSSVVYGDEGEEQLVVTPKRGMQTLKIFTPDGSVQLLDRSIDNVLSVNTNVITAVVPF